MVFNDNKVCSNNEIDVFSKNTLISFNGVFDGLEKSLSLLFPSVREAVVERYRAQTLAAIGMEAYRLIQQNNLQVNPIPPKAALPLIEKASLEHEEDMYEQWAKLLVASATNYNPLQIQYADILSKIGSDEAKHLKIMYESQSKHSCGKFLEYNLQTNDFQTLTRVLFDDKEFVFKPKYPKDEYLTSIDIRDFLFKERENIFKKNKFLSIAISGGPDIDESSFNDSLLNLTQLNIVKVQKIKHYNMIIAYLTQFGYSMMECLEGINKN